MNVNEAIEQACASVGIKPPRAYQPGRWAKCDTLDGKSGKGDGRVNVDDLKVTAFNWKLGQSATIWLKDRDSLSPVEKRQFAERKAKDDAEQKRRTDEAARIASAIVETATLKSHPYLAAKGFASEKALVVDSSTVRRIGGEYLIAGERAVVMPARMGQRITSVQLIWEDGTKKFLAGGEISGSCHRIAKGADTWLCEGYATGLSLRSSLKSLNRADTVLCCFSASNVAAVAKRIDGRCYIAADHDKPMEQFGGLGTGEHWARVAAKPYALPPEPGDINDMHMSAGIFAVQKLLAETIRKARA
jgi:putative DNA primase/helicase